MATVPCCPPQALLSPGRIRHWKGKGSFLDETYKRLAYALALRWRGTTRRNHRLKGSNSNNKDNDNATFTGQATIPFGGGSGEGSATATSVTSVSSVMKKNTEVTEALGGLAPHTAGLRVDTPFVVMNLAVRASRASDSVVERNA